MGSIDGTDAIPMADISAFVNGSSTAQERQAAAKEFAAAVKIHGCAGIYGHGLDESELRDIQAMMRRFFDLPLAEKMKAPHPEEQYPHRGYSKTSVERSGVIGIAHSKSEEEKAFLAKAVDFKETYDIGHEDDVEERNIWLPDDVLPGFRSSMTKAHLRLYKVAEAVLEALIAGMELSPEDRETMHQINGPLRAHLRLAHYLPMSPEKQNDPYTIRLAPHKDFSSFTLLFQDTQPGLEFQNRETGAYMAATPREGVCYLNVGDLLERYSNGFYPSAMHRVSIPTAAKDSDGTIKGRLSIPYFVGNGEGKKGTIYPMPSRVQLDGKQVFEAVPFQKLAHDLFAPTSS